MSAGKYNSPLRGDRIFLIGLDEMSVTIAEWQPPEVVLFQISSQVLGSIYYSS